ncbi:Imm30 family immunity protein [Metabacillus fastidiosus]|uniref:Imm30 family immunity protein n=1 Tax=Metabacillus fastidiosus TaxID=1458 RepID=A0ABU6NZW1_9BACI|nr:Imm30 family immunity protein [Metabacillus fastidiosus]MED4402571.1 Imm30 family immunity protein [Metabacillus fastidiosus]MED4461931.1 Imm30 family immunity protein [Metabacillus fastidiosus]
MTVKEQISILYKMRFLGDNDDGIEVFEDILTELFYRGTNDIIPDLCTIFEDDIAEPSAGDDLIKTIFYIVERNGLEDGLYKLAISISKMLPHAEFWAERIHGTLLNSKGLVAPYIKALENVDSSTKQIIKEILLVIKEDDPDLYLEKVNLIIERIRLIE